MLDAIRARITREVTDFAGAIDTWDADQRSRHHARLRGRGERDHPAGAARGTRRHGPPGVRRPPARANPKATLLLNDFDLSPEYEHLIEDCLAAGVRIDALGLQSHMHQGYWGEEKTERILDRFARFRLPLHMTETTLVSGHLMPTEIVDLNDYQIPSWPSTPEGEERQADEIVRHYTTLVRSPCRPRGRRTGA